MIKLSFIFFPDHVSFRQILAISFLYMNMTEIFRRNM